MAISAMKVARIFYRTDAGRTDAEELSLGILIFAEQAANADASIMMLVARDELDPSWASKMNPVARKLLEKPNVFFQHEIEAAVKDGTKDILLQLASKFSWSISISPPVEYHPPVEIVEMFERIIEDKIKSKPTLVRSKRVGSVKGRRPALILPHHSHDSELLVQIAGPDLQDAVNLGDLPPAWMIASSKFSGPHI